jgi:hypothetical protein
MRKKFHRFLAKFNKTFMPFSLQKMLESHKEMMSGDSGDCGGQNLSPSKQQLAPHRNSLFFPTSVCVINPHHPNVAARTSSTSNVSGNTVTTPTSPRPSATDLVSQSVTIFYDICWDKGIFHFVSELHSGRAWNPGYRLSWHFCVW